MDLRFSLSPSSLVPNDLHKVGFLQKTRTRCNAKLFTPSSSLLQFPREVDCQSPYSTSIFPFLKCATNITTSRKMHTQTPRSSGSPPPNGGPDDSEGSVKAKVPFGYSRKDVLLIGVGVTLLGVGLKSGLEFVGVDPLQAGNVVQLVLVLGLTIGWISTYIFRVSNKEMTYATQLRDYESKVMEKRLEGLTEAELQVLLEQVEEEKQTLASGKKVN